MPIRQALALLQFLLLALVCFGGAYYFSHRSAAPVSAPAPIALMYSPGAVVAVE
ncbi:hypothetical protein [Hymenobacter cellulosilyticus]|uniref:Uncharacterized protein n=1 Tax=Hymenobacter cellulosilyticus TaxID=2932248 RepID=A0A8T9Q0G3_9BACT|nr:hypothetical protein [Hymenobacter cellulosilyticus]UOQ70352.1 hypothetical protein MUN79_16570 [Hymenobacter cellulosilyticus]